jgi:hypothetical protein
MHTIKVNVITGEIVQIPYTAEEQAQYDINKAAEETANLAKQVEIAKTQYQRDRAKEYPPITDYIDGIVKGDTAQVQTYIDACLAVKSKYPKPE